MGPGALIVFLTAAAYFPAFRCGFNWDDEAYVTENHVLRSLEGLRKIWTQPGGGLQQYYPLTFTGFWIEYHLWDLHPFPYHVVNVLLHAVNAVLLWCLLRRLEIPGSWWAAAIFALHPMQVESVAWITELKNVLSGLFSLLSLLMFLRFRPLSASGATAPRDWRFYTPALLLFLCALLSKTAVCCLPLVIVVLMWWKLDRVPTEDVLLLFPWFVASLTLGLITVAMENHAPGAGAGNFAPSILRALLVGSHALWFYAGKLLWPANLCFIYPRWQLRVDSVATWLPLAGLGVVAGTLWRFRRAHWARATASGLGCFIVALLPVLGFFNIYFFRFSFVADHFQYLGGIAPIVLVVGAGTAVSQRAGPRGSHLATLIAGAVLVVLGVSTWGQSHIYYNPETLWHDTLVQNPNAWLAHNNLGVILGQAGRFEDAISHYEQALRIKPDYAQAHYNLGVALFHLGRTQEAVGHWERALQIEPDYAKAHDYLGNALAQAGRFEDAISHYEQALRIKPDYAQAHYNLGLALLHLGRTPEAVEHWEQALRIEPDYAEVHNDLGAELAQAGKIDEAIWHYEQALRARPDFANAHNNLGNALARAGRLDEAIEQYEQALRIKPDLAESHYNLGVALEHVGRVGEAIEHYEQALRIRPDYAEAQDRLAQLKAAR